MGWYTSINEEERNEVKHSYSGWLKTELATHPFKTLTFSQIAEAIELSVSKATEGKITLVPA
jgi:hypothetical protein